MEAPGQLPSGLGFRKVNMMPSGEPKRTEATPVAFPGYAGYPPDRDAATGTQLDYALKAHGGTFTLKTQHPDVVSSRAKRASAGTWTGTAGGQTEVGKLLYQGKGIY